MPKQKLNWLTFNMALNDLISTYLDDGGDPARIADSLCQIGHEVFDDACVSMSSNDRDTVVI